MKKFLFILFGLFVIAGAFAAGENIPTSKSYVDSKLGEKQDTIPANDGTTQVLTNTGTAGEYGTKGIYDANGAYATQTQNLVDAATMNAGVQNAINSEFQCIEWANPNDHSSDCLLMDVFGQTEHRSPNLFDSSQILKASGWTENNGVYSGQINNLYRLGDMIISQEFKPDTQYTLSYTLANDENNIYADVNARFQFRYTDGTTSSPSNYVYTTISTDPLRWRVVARSASGKTISALYTNYNHNGIIYLSDIQLQEGTTATPYVPYGNLYLPNGE